MHLQRYLPLLTMIDTKINEVINPKSGNASSSVSIENSVSWLSVFSHIINSSALSVNELPVILFQISVQLIGSIIISVENWFELYMIVSEFVVLVLL